MLIPDRTKINWSKVTDYESDIEEVVLFAGKKRMGTFSYPGFTSEDLHQFKNKFQSSRKG